MKYIKNEMSMNEFVNAALNAEPAQALERYEADGRLVSIMNKVTGEVFDIEWADMMNQGQYEEAFKGAVNTAKASMLNMLSFFDNVVISGSRRVLDPETDEVTWEIVTLTKDVPEVLLSKTIKQLCNGENEGL